jgi:hypothetical protein
MSDSKQYNFRFPIKVGTIFEEAARASNMSLTSWLVQVGLAAAGHTSLSDQLARVTAPKTPRKRIKKR